MQCPLHLAVRLTDLVHRLTPDKHGGAVCGRRLQPRVLACFAAAELELFNGAMLQAAAWLSWEYAVSSSRTSSLQFWSGSQWQQTEFPNPDKLRPSLPLTATPATQAEAAPAAPHAQAEGSASASKGGAAETSSSPEGGAQAGPISGFTAQAMLECHYSHHGAFLKEPLLQVPT